MDHRWASLPPGFKLERMDPNSRCSCKSGRKFKDCCGLTLAGMIKLQQEHSANIASAGEGRFGMVRPTLAPVFQGHRFVGAGGNLVVAPVSEWRMFPDFLSSYLRSLLGAEWGGPESQY